MQYIVFDLEWNQPYLHKGQPRPKTFEVMPFEIFQIGAVKLDKDFNQVGRFSVNIRLQQYKRLHFMVKRITNVTQHDLSSGLLFADAVNKFRRWCGTDVTFLTWGYDDVPILRQNLRFYGLDETWCQPAYNLQILFNRMTDDGKNQRSLEYAMEYFEIEENNAFHNALNDAMYTAEVAKKMDIRKGLDDYETSIWTIRPERISKSFPLGAVPTREDALEHPLCRSVYCPICRKAIMRDHPWEQMQDGTYVLTASCTVHGEFTYRVRYRKDRELGGFQAALSVKNVKSRKKKKILAKNKKADS